MPLLQRADPVTRFALAVVVLLPFYLFIWYVAAPLLNWPLAAAADWLLPGLFPGTFVAVVQEGLALDVITRLPLPDELRAQMPPGTTGDLTFSVNPLIYSYGLPFFTALAIAVPGGEGDKWLRWLWGLPWLLAAQVFGVCMDSLKTVLIQFSSGSAEMQQLAAWQREGIALGYQLGFLILPSVLPVVLWMTLFRGFLASLVKGPAAASGRAPP
jgi:hypothetical protein